MRLRLGTPVVCTDGAYGDLADVVIDPVARHVTHLVIEPHHHHGLARLVPLDLASPAPGPNGEISLRCTTADVHRLDAVQEFAYLRVGERPAQGAGWDVGVEDLLALPCYDGSASDAYWLVEPAYGISYDRIPKGEVEIRDASLVSSADDHVLGHVGGFLVDPDSNITHLVLRRGHLWGRREVTIPIGAVANVATDSVTLSLTTDDVAALPRVHIGRGSGGAGGRGFPRSGDAA